MQIPVMCVFSLPRLDSCEQFCINVAHCFSVAKVASCSQMNIIRLQKSSSSDVLLPHSR